MQNRYPILFLIGLGACLLMVGGVLVGASPMQAAANDTPAETFVDEFPLPGDPENIVVQAAGRVWFTMPETNAIGSLVVTSAANYTVKTYPLPNSGSFPYDLVFDGDETIWFTQRHGNRIGRINVNSGQIQEYTIPTANSEPTGIDIGSDGRIWFSEHAGNKLGTFNPQTETFVERPYPSAGTMAEDVAVAPGGCGSGSGCVWTTSPAKNQVIAWVFNTQDFLPVTTVDLLSGVVAEPWHATIDAFNVVWMTTRAGNRVGRYAPGTITVWRWFTAPTANSNPTGIAYQFRANQQYIWFTEQASGKVGQLVLKATGDHLRLREYALPAASGQAASAEPDGIAADDQGYVWIADAGGQRILRWRAPYLELYLPRVAQPE